MREQERRERESQNETEADAERRRILKGKGKVVCEENPQLKRMRSSGIQIREREAMRSSGIQIREREDTPYAHEDAESGEETVILHRRVGVTSTDQNIEMSSVGEDDVVSDDYENDEVDYDSDELCDTTTIENRGAALTTDEKFSYRYYVKPPIAFRELFDGTNAESVSFRTYIREHNAENAFTSLGCKLDTRDLKGRGPRPFSIHGELRHLTGSVLPAPGTERRAVYSQLYIYDPSFALFVRGERNPELNMNVLQTIQNTMLQFNVFYTKYRQAYAILDQMSPVDQHIRVSLQYNKSTNIRRYNLPTADEIAVIVPEITYKENGVRDIILHLRENNGLKQISECHPAYLPLHYVLLFPFGEMGWSPTMRQWDAVTQTYTKTKLSQMEYYSYRIFERTEEYSTILRAGKLFQEFLVDAWEATEQSKLAWLRFNQPTLRSDQYSCIADMTNADLNLGDRGNPVILPSSHTGSGRHMHEIYQDSMTITRFHHHPDIFLTMTANPNWPEIRNALIGNQSVTDRPDLVARVFELKRKALMKEIKEKRFVSAEFPDEKNDPILFDTASKCMVHGPCGERDPGAACMSKGKCTKGYPKKYTDTTTLDEGVPVIVVVGME
ncbi:uncharacterized protein LOC113305150 [Papaver somniferum]|uniref:uncharacterized protein LOC113305150 n=1 Tax=Papaver somniferum TaxID=3469 RepID=UPI000E6FD49D|nr:uncharacterized protein LOC113305150 [Papaver somniferum]